MHLLDEQEVQIMTGQEVAEPLRAPARAWEEWR